jgi:septal ring factor EnvC (AmiA/AmiB activator)
MGVKGLIYYTFGYQTVRLGVMVRGVGIQLGGGSFLDAHTPVQHDRGHLHQATTRLLLLGRSAGCTASWPPSALQHECGGSPAASLRQQLEYVQAKVADVEEKITDVSGEIEGLKVQLKAAEEEAKDQGKIVFLRQRILSLDQRILKLQDEEMALRQKKAKLTPGIVHIYSKNPTPLLR